MQIGDYKLIWPTEIKHYTALLPFKTNCQLCMISVPCSLLSWALQQKIVLVFSADNWGAGPIRLYRRPLISIVWIGFETVIQVLLDTRDKSNR